MEPEKTEKTEKTEETEETEETETKETETDTVPHKLRVILRHYDQDGTGTISRSQFEAILRATLPPAEILCKEEVDRMWAWFEHREDGDIEQEDLAKWIMKPSTPLMLDAEHGICTFFDLRSALHPLFQAYDQNGDSSVDMREFLEAHGVLQNALRLNPVEGHEDPVLLRGDLTNCFLHIGFETEKRLTFEKFVQWQRLALMPSTLPPEDLAKVLKSTAKQMQRVFKLSAAEKRGELTESDRLVLKRILTQLAQFSRDLWSSCARDVSHSRRAFKNKWAPPCVGMNVDHLKEVFLRDFSCSRLRFTSKVQSYDWDIFCVPAIPAKNRRRDWLARVRLRTTLTCGRKLECEHHYIYDRCNFTWLLWEEVHSEAQDLTEKETEMAPELASRSFNPNTRRADSSSPKNRARTSAAAAFEAAVTGLSPEVRLFSLLKTTANFGLRLSWAQLQQALYRALQLDIITEAQLHSGKARIEAVMLQAMENEGRYPDIRDIDLYTSPSQVMSIFAELGVFAVTSVWADFLDT